MRSVKEVIVVEGRYDKNTLSQAVDAIIVETSGFGIFNDGEKQKLLRRMAEARGLVVLTDSDGAGFMDLVALGIGVNGSIGFNEPATPFESFTHSQQLTDATREQLAGVFGSADVVPEKGVTMGIKTIMSARSVILIASGEEKADIVYKMVYGKTVTYVPASMLQIHLDMTLYLDEAAASKLN